MTPHNAQPPQNINPLSGPWTRFMDMHSGGGAKEKQEYIYIQAPEKEAIVIFYNRFGHNPHRVTCTCCGEDYSVHEHPTLQRATAYERNCDYEGNDYVERQRTKYNYSNRPLISVKEYCRDKNVLVIPASQISPSERIGDVPQQGYIWRD